MRKKDYTIDDNGNLVIKEGVEVIPPYAFSDKGIRSVKFPSTLKIISSYAFSSNRLTRVKFPDGLRYIGIGAFEDNVNLSSIIFNEGLEAIEEEAFLNHGADSIYLPESLVYLGRKVFKNEYRKCVVHIHPENIYYADFEGNSLDNMDPSLYKKSAFLGYTSYLNRIENQNLDDDNVMVTASDILNTFDLNKGKIINIGQDEKNNLGEEIKEKIDNYLSYKSDIFISTSSLLTDIEKLIINGADIDYVDQNGMPLLMYAYTNHLNRVLYLLIKYGANINITNEKGMNLLMHAINNNDSSLFTLLLELGCDVNARDSEYNTALMYAIKKKKVSFIKALISNNAFINATNASNQSVIDIAYETGIREIISLFNSQEVDTGEANVEKDLADLKLLLTNN